MKFFITEQNIGDDVTREQTDQIIAKLREKGWDVEYGRSKNRTTDVSEFGREQVIQDAFGDEFMRVCDEVLLESDK